jgi:hypothetical protein
VHTHHLILTVAATSALLLGTAACSSSYADVLEISVDVVANPEDTTKANELMEKSSDMSAALTTITDSLTECS